MSLIRTSANIPKSNASSRHHLSRALLSFSDSVLLALPSVMLFVCLFLSSSVCCPWPDLLHSRKVAASASMLMVSGREQESSNHGLYVLSYSATGWRKVFLAQLLGESHPLIFLKPGFLN